MRNELVARSVGRRSRPLPVPLVARSLAASLLVVAGAALVAGCDDGGSGGSGGTGGTGGSGGAGGTGGTGGGATTATIEACPIGAEVHVAATIIGPDGTIVGDENVDVTGVVTGASVDSPPTFDCGAGMAWAQIEEDGGAGTWLGCFQAPSLLWNVTAGQVAQLRQIAQTHPIAPASKHTTLRADDALVVHVELATVEEEVSLPDGLGLARGDQVCASPEDPCRVEGYAATATLGDSIVELTPGETTPVGLKRIYLDRYWLEKISSGCDGGGAHILLSVTPNPDP